MRSVKFSKTLYSDTAEIYIEAETLGANLAYTETLLASLATFNQDRKRPVTFGANIAVTGRVKGNRELLESFRRAGFKYLNIGLESGSVRIRKEVLARPAHSNQDIIEFCQLAEEVGIKIRMYVIIGLPTESLEDYKETVECVRACNPSAVYLSIFYPYPGTALYDMCREEGWLDGNVKLDVQERNTPVLNLPTFSAKKVRIEYLLFNYRVYSGFLPLSQIFARILRTFLLGYPTFNSAYRYLTRNNSMFRFLKTKLTPY